MDQNNKKIITVSFVIVAFLIGFIVKVLLETFSASFGFVAILIENDAIRHGIPFLSGLITFLILQFKKSINIWADEVVSEIKKVVWPSRKDTMAMVVVVCAMLIISGIILGLFDVVSGYVINFVMMK